MPTVKKINDLYQKEYKPSPGVYSSQHKIVRVSITPPPGGVQFPSIKYCVPLPIGINLFL